ncbi:uncharacterized protein ACRADG_010295 isoform 1-T1 [Cochliomyia hominivorax]
MKSVNRYTGGIIIGSLYIFIYVITIIFLIYKFNEEKPKTCAPPSTHADKILEYSLILYFAVQAASAALLIWGIVKRNHRLMVPWFIFFLITFVIFCIYLFGFFMKFIIFDGFNNANIMETLELFILFGFQIFSFVYQMNLSTDMRQQNIENDGRIEENSTEIKSQTPEYFYAAMETKVDI